MPVDHAASTDVRHVPNALKYAEPPMPLAARMEVLASETRAVAWVLDPPPPLIAELQRFGADYPELAASLGNLIKPKLPPHPDRDLPELLGVVRVSYWCRVTLGLVDHDIKALLRAHVAHHGADDLQSGGLCRSELDLPREDHRKAGIKALIFTARGMTVVSCDRDPNGRLS